jgi:hypothetical protein
MVFCPRHSCCVDNTFSTFITGATPPGSEARGRLHPRKSCETVINCISVEAFDESPRHFAASLIVDAVQRLRESVDLATEFVEPRGLGRAMRPIPPRSERSGRSFASSCRLRARLQLRKCVLSSNPEAGTCRVLYRETGAIGADDSNWVA